MSDYERGYHEGAAAVLGVIGMFEAIRKRYVFCPDCGAGPCWKEGIYHRCPKGHYFQPGAGAWF